MNKIKDRDARTKSRKKAKAKFDKKITLSMLSSDENRHFCKFAVQSSEGKARLLDEGALVAGGNKLDLYIEKGALKKYMQGKNKKLTPRYLVGDRAEEFFDEPDKPLNIDEKFEGYINVGHNNFATFPFVIGKWRQSDLSLADNGDGRKGLDVDLKLNELHPFVQAFRVQGIPLGPSVEMWVHEDPKGTEEIQKKISQEDQLWGNAIAVDEVFIAEFAVVGECGNVGSSGTIDFQGVKMEKDTEMTLEDVEDATLEEVAEENEMSEDDMLNEEESAEEETTQDEPTEDETDDDEQEEEEVNDDEAEEDGEEDVDEELTLSAIMDKFNALDNKVTELVAQNEMLKKQNRKLKNKLAAKNEAEKNFFKGLSVSLGIDTKDKNTESTEKASVSKDYATGDGIGE